MGYAIYKSGFVVNTVELVGDGAVDRYLYRPGGQFGDDDADGRGGDGIGAVWLLQIEPSACVIIRLATGLNRYGAVRRLGNCRSDGRTIGARVPRDYIAAPKAAAVSLSCCAHSVGGIEWN